METKDIINYLTEEMNHVMINKIEKLTGNRYSSDEIKCDFWNYVVRLPDGEEISMGTDVEALDRVIDYFKNKF